MLIEIFSIVGDTTEHVGCRILTVDSKPTSAGFYEKSDFRRALVNPEGPQKDTIPFYFDVLHIIQARKSL